MAVKVDPSTDRRAAIYARLSRDKKYGKVQEGEKVEAQIKLCREFAERNGLEVVATFSDNDQGASDKTRSKKPRKGYDDLQIAARAGEFATIIATENSRLTRRPSELEGLIRLHEDTKVVIRTVRTGDDDLSSESGKMVARIKSNIDAHEAGVNSERSLSSHGRTRLEGKHKRSPWRAFGFMDDGITHHPTEARLIQEAVAKLIDGASIRQIGKSWEELGITSTRGATYWGHSRLKDVLLSWKAAGIRGYKDKAVIDPDGEMVKAEWKPIISVQDRQRALDELETHYAKPKRRSGKWLLAGLVVCGKPGCLRPLYGNHGGETRASSYICSNGRSAHLGIRADKLETYLETVVYRYILERAIFGEKEPEPSEIPEWPDEQRILDLTERIAELMEAHTAKILPGNIVFPQANKLDQERQTLTEERTRYYAQNKPRKHTVMTKEEAFEKYRAIKELPFLERQLTLKREIQSVVILPGKQGSRSYAEFKARVHIEWIEPHPEFLGRSAEEAASEGLLALPLEWAVERPEGWRYQRRTPEEILKWRADFEAGKKTGG